MMDHRDYLKQSFYQHHKEPRFTSQRAGMAKVVIKIITKNCGYPLIVIAIVPAAFNILSLILTTALQSTYFLSCISEAQGSKVAPAKSIRGRMKTELIAV